MKTRRRTIIALTVGVVLGAGVVVAKPWLQRQVLAPKVGAGKTPSMGAMDQFVATYSDPAEPLEFLWNSGGISQREYVISCLRRSALGNQDAWNKMRPVILASVAMPDEELRQLVMLLLEKNRDPEVAALALPLLKDADPNSRITGLHAFTALDDHKWMGAVGPLLDDPEPAVRIVAAATVWKMVQADVPMSERGSATIEELAAKWWAAHRADIPAMDAGTPSNAVFAMAPELHVVDLDGKPVNLQELHGKKVMLSFWATWCGPCLEELPTIEEVAKRHEKDLVVVGISIDCAPDDDGDLPELTPPQVTEKIGDLRRQYGLTYRIGLDMDGRAMNAFGGESIPTSILIDGDGWIRRRVVGQRSVEAWDAMIADMDRVPATLPAH